MKRPPSNLELHSLCSNGNLEELRTFLEKTVHSLSQDEQITLCSHAGKPCQNVPCTNKVTSLAETAAKANQPAIFAYLWDSILGPRDCRISWTSLRAAARLGSIFLAQTFHARDLECFNIVEPPSPHGSRGGGTQIEVGMRHDNFDYVNFIQVHGADMNNNFPNRSPIRAAVLSAIGDDKSLQRIRFLAERGAWIRGSGALRAAAGEGRTEVVRYLLDNGSDPDDLGSQSDETYQKRTSSALIAAAEAGHEDIIKILLDHEADFEFVDRFGMSALTTAEKFNQTRAVEVLREWQASHG